MAGIFLKSIEQFNSCKDILLDTSRISDEDFTAALELAVEGEDLEELFRRTGPKSEMEKFMEKYA